MAIAAGTFKSLELHGVGRSFGGRSALEDLNLTVRAGEFIALLGPSGCGKSTALNCIAGLLPLTHGQILIDGARVDTVAAEKRGFGMVFQNYALFPHLTVEKNIAFGLQMRGIPKPEVKRRVGEAIALVKLEEHATKLPGQLGCVLLELDQGDGLADATLHLRLGDASHLQAERDVLLDGEVREQRIVLEHHAEPPLLGGHGVHPCAVDEDLAVGERQQACDAVQCGGLSAARGSEQGDELARPDCQVEVLQRTTTAEAATDAVKLQRLERSGGDGHGYLALYFPLPMVRSQMSKALTIRAGGSGVAFGILAISGSYQVRPNCAMTSWLALGALSRVAPVIAGPG